MIKKSQHEDNVKLRDLARSRGDKYYEATRPCKHGHLIRRVSDNRCDACGKAKDKRAKEKMLSTPEVRQSTANGAQITRSLVIKMTRNIAVP